MVSIHNELINNLYKWDDKCTSFEYRKYSSTDNRETLYRLSHRTVQNSRRVCVLVRCGSIFCLVRSAAAIGGAYV